MWIRTTTSKELEVSVGKCRYHGGAVPEGYLDFSAPLNPLGTPKVLKDLIVNTVFREVYSRYPDHTYSQLRNAIAYFYGTNPEGVIPLNGASEAIYLLVLALRPKVLVVFEPTFGDHKYLSEAIGLKTVSVIYVESEDRYEFPADLLKSVSTLNSRETLVLLSNPNNPTGTTLSKNQLTEVLEAFADSVVLVDEAYQELCYSCEDVDAVKLTNSYENLVVVRSLTKTYAVPGLRVGFLYTSNAKLVKVVEASRPPWNVNSLASEVFTKAFNEHVGELKSFISLSKNVIKSEVEYVSKNLKSIGLHVYKSSVPYILVRHRGLTTESVIALLTRQKVYIRDASRYPGLTPYHARISVKLRHENDVLLSSYKEVFKT
ncbi:MAG: histidinol-phosphate transaminase [Sulfolobales archaeon]